MLLIVLFILFAITFILLANHEKMITKLYDKRLKEQQEEEREFTKLMKDLGEK